MNTFCRAFGREKKSQRSRVGRFRRRRTRHERLLPHHQPSVRDHRRVQRARCVHGRRARVRRVLHVHRDLADDVLGSVPRVEHEQRVPCFGGDLQPRRGVVLRLQPLIAGEVQRRMHLHALGSAVYRDVRHGRHSAVLQSQRRGSAVAHGDGVCAVGFVKHHVAANGNVAVHLQLRGGRRCGVEQGNVTHADVACGAVHPDAPHQREVRARRGGVRAHRGGHSGIGLGARGSHRARREKRQDQRERFGSSRVRRARGGEPRSRHRSRHPRRWGGEGPRAPDARDRCVGGAGETVRGLLFRGASDAASGSRTRVARGRTHVSGPPPSPSARRARGRRASSARVTPHPTGPALARCASTGFRTRDADSPRGAGGTLFARERNFIRCNFSSARRPPADATRTRTAEASTSVVPLERSFSAYRINSK